MPNPNRTRDPQYFIMAQVKKSHQSDSEVIVFERPLSRIAKEVFIVPIPDEGVSDVKVYVKTKLDPSAVRAALSQDNSTDEGRRARREADGPEEEPEHNG
jgi:hypothetical protein